MRHLMLIKVSDDGYKSGAPPPPALQAAMGALMGQWGDAGLIASAEGLTAPADGGRVRIVDGKVTDGPFAEAREVIGGLFVLNTTSKAHALSLAKDVVETHLNAMGPSFEIEVEVRGLEE